MMHTFDATAYGPVVQSLLAEGRLPELGPGSPNPAANSVLANLTIEKLFGDRPVRDADMARCCLAGLWLHHDFLDESHTISQEIETASGSYWHAIMHRREPDADNSKYWFRRVGPHSVLDELVRHAPALGYSYTTPSAFVDICERVRDSGSGDEAVARRVQLLEWQLLFDWCWRQAPGQ